MEDQNKEEVVEKTDLQNKLQKLEDEGVIAKEGEEVKLEEKPLTQEQKDALAKHEAEVAEKKNVELAKKQKAFEMLQQGGYFMKYIYDDIQRQKQEQMNRPQRKRFERELRKGIFSKELVEVYVTKIDSVKKYIDDQLNPKEVKQDYKVKKVEDEK